MQPMSLEHIPYVLAEQELPNSEVEMKRKQLELWGMQLNRHETPTESDTLKLDQENNKREKDMFKLAQNMLNLAGRREEDNHKLQMENHKLQKENLKLQMENDKLQKENLKLEIENQDLKGKLQVMKHGENEEAEAWKSKMKEMQQELEEKDEQMDYLEQLNRALLVKERLSNDELQEVRKELIKELERILKGPRTNISLKRMGEIDTEPFQQTCKRRFPVADEAQITAAELCSLWQKNVNNAEWHPFKVVAVEGNSQPKEVIDPSDGMLKNLKEEWGNEIYEAVCKALLKMNEYNPSGRYVVYEHWDRKEDRKATMKEVVSYIFRRLKNKRKRNCV